MSKALGVLSARPYRSHEALGALGPGVFVLEPFPPPPSRGWTAAKALRCRRRPVVLAHGLGHSGLLAAELFVRPSGVLVRSLHGRLPLAGETFPGGPAPGCRSLQGKTGLRLRVRPVALC